MRPCLILAAVLLGLALAGCSKREGHEKYVPPEGRAREALQAALTAWKNGQPKEGLKVGNTAITVIDPAWSPGQRLDAFEIVGEKPGDGPRFFTVKLTTPRGQKTVTYVVLGIDPLWVYSEAEYKKVSGG
jgi:hypothetical protein